MGEGTQEDAATPAGEGPQSGVGGASEEVDGPVLQGLRWIRRREDELHVDAFLLEEPKLHSSDGHEVGRRDRISNGEPHQIRASRSPPCACGRVSVSVSGLPLVSGKNGAATRPRM